VLNLLGELKARGLGILFITHDLSLGNYISDRTIILQRGSVVEMGPTLKVFGNPVHPYTRMLLDCVPQLHTKWGERDASVPSIGSISTNGVALAEVEPGHFAAVPSSAAAGAMEAR
jgi:ABC-type oligopeptide transport system ATPase subunit